MTRERLPDRRKSENFRFKVGTTSYHATVGYYHDGRPGELFLNCEKTGTDLQVYMRDSAIAVSMALQGGVPIETLAKAMCRHEDGSPEGLLGQFLDMYAEGEQG